MTEDSINNNEYYKLSLSNQVASLPESQLLTISIDRLIGLYQWMLNHIVRYFFSLHPTPISRPVWWTSDEARCGAKVFKNARLCGKLGSVLKKKLAVQSEPPTLSREANSLSMTEYAAFVSQAILFLKDILVPFDTQNLAVTSHTVQVHPLNSTLYSAEYGYYRHLLVAQRYASGKFEKELVDALVFGSLVDRQVAKGFSDFDLLLIISSNTTSNPSQLLAVREKILPLVHQTYLFNVLHHHMPFICTEVDLHFYPQAFFPITLFDYSASLMHTAPIEIPLKARSSVLEDCERFWERVDKVKRAATRRHQKLDVWRSLSDISGFFLLAPLFLQLHGTPVYKRDAFPQLRIKLPHLDWALYEKLSYIREQIFPRLGHRLNLLRPLSWYNPMLVGRGLVKLGYAPKVLKEAFSPDLYPRMADFASALLEHARTTGVLKTSILENR